MVEDNLSKILQFWVPNKVITTCPGSKPIHKGLEIAIICNLAFIFAGFSSFDRHALERPKITEEWANAMEFEKINGMGKAGKHTKHGIHHTFESPVGIFTGCRSHPLLSGFRKTVWGESHWVF